MRHRNVTIRGLGHRYGDGPWLFNGLDADLQANEVYALVGPSGSGKSTLLSLVAGWEAPRAGRIVRHCVGRVGWVFQNPHGVARRAAVDHVALPFMAGGRTRRDAVRLAVELMDQFGIAELAARQFSQLSGGEAQRLMLARAIAAQPDVLLVDEPTAQLDLETAATVSSALGVLSGRGVIVVVATHDATTRAACSRTIDLAEYRRGAAS